VRSAKQNSQLNGCPGAIRIWRQDILKFEPKARYDIVVANLYSDLLGQAVPRLVNAACDHGFLIFSGILRNQAQEVTARLNRSDAELREVRTRGKWTTFLVQKKPGQILG